MSKLRERMIEDMTLAGLSEGTQKEYVRAVASFAQEFACSPEGISEELVRVYLLNLRDVKKVALGTFQVHYSALKFLYQITLDLGWPLFAKKRFASLVKSACRIH
jgi:integrase/recombinase XerD